MVFSRNINSDHVYKVRLDILNEDRTVFYASRVKDITAAHISKT